MTSYTNLSGICEKRSELLHEWADLEYPTTTHPGHTPRSAAAAARIKEISVELDDLDAAEAKLSSGANLMAYVVHDDQTIWGVGNTEASAWQDAEEWSENGTDNLKIAQASEALAAHVRNSGGACAFHEEDGILKLWKHNELH